MHSVTYLHAMFDEWSGTIPVEKMRTLAQARAERAMDGVSAAKGRHMAIKDF